AIKNKINASPFPIVHLATHGQFSSDPEKTLIYAWQEKIRVKELDNILRSRGKTIRGPIELLVLSACETAQGDERATLGLAGVALRARARSTVASLWKVSDSSTARFMKDFYQELNKKNTTKAEALREVQIKFLQDSYDQHPYYWAAFILSGKWL
ncbi:MAG: CHAT domain-containing protein, partial [Symploca sp. SIO1A3]|nr:CHAT domain-containing protein [Symploca sp. SIO1A3]